MSLTASIQRKKREREERMLKHGKRSGSTTGISKMHAVNERKAGTFSSYIPEKSFPSQQTSAQHSLLPITLYDQVTKKKRKTTSETESNKDLMNGVGKGLISDVLPDEEKEVNGYESDSSAIGRNLEEIKDFKVLDTMFAFPSDPKKQDARDEGSRVILTQILPVDWSLCEKVRIESNLNLSWMRQDRMDQDISSLEKILFGAKDTADDSDLHISPDLDPWGVSQAPNVDANPKSQSIEASLELWTGATLQWVYPGMSLPPDWYLGSDESLQKTATSASFQVKPIEGKATDRARFFRKRVLEWEQAFRSLYLSLRRGDCPYFYYKTNQNSILWRLVGKERHPFAFMSKCSKRFRNKLKSADIEFTDPFSDGKDDPPNGQEEIEVPDPKQSKNSKLNGILFTKHKDVHALFSILLECQGNDRGLDRTKFLKEDLPVLISPTVFLHSSLKKVEVKSCTKVRKGSLPQKMSLVELTGPILPTSLQQMCSSIQNILSHESMIPKANEDPMDVSEGKKEDSYVLMQIEKEEETAFFNHSDLLNKAVQKHPADSNINEAAEMLKGKEHMEELKKNELIKEVHFSFDETNVIDSRKDKGEDCNQAQSHAFVPCMNVMVVCGVSTN